MSTPEFSTHVGQDCGSELLENSQSLSVLKIEDKIGDDISQTGEAEGVNLKEDADHHSANEPTNTTITSEVKSCTVPKIDRLNDPSGKIFLQNFMKAIQAAQEAYSDDDESDEDEPVKVSDGVVHSKCWAEQSSGQNSGHTTDADCPELPTHPGQPWESDEEEESDSDYDDEEEVSGREYGTTTSATIDGHIVEGTDSAIRKSVTEKAVRYKTPFGRIILAPSQIDTASANNSADTEQICQPKVGAPPEDVTDTLASTEESPTMYGDNKETVKALPHSVAAPIEPIAEPETFRNEFYEVKKSATAGYGAFALQKLVRGQTILIEKSLFHADNATLRTELKKLSPDLRAAFDRMHGHGIGEYDTMLLRRIAIFKTNSFMVNYYDRGVFLTASKFNHACRPRNNVAYTYDKRHDCMVFTIERDVEAGDELYITYGKDPETLLDHYGFVCRCGACLFKPAKQVHQIVNSEWPWA